MGLAVYRGPKADELDRRPCIECRCSIYLHVKGPSALRDVPNECLGCGGCVLTQAEAAGEEESDGGGRPDAA